MSNDPKDPKAGQPGTETELSEGKALAISDEETAVSLGTPDGEGLAEPEGEEHLATEAGVEKYVHAAFFAAAILAAFLGGKMLLSLWNNVVEWPAAVRALPVLLEYTEEERGNITLIIGTVLGVFTILRYYRRPSVRSWATSVAGELARVTWPSKDTVTNGTIVVLVAGAIATVYVALLDRLWSYLTNLVYGA
jgi:preprotein translocase subunit SecE